MDNQIMYDLLREVREDQKKHGEELAKQSVWLIYIQKDVQINTDDLSEHIKRTQLNEDQIKILKDMSENINKRVEVLEEPNKVKDFLYKRSTKYFAIITSIVTVVGYFGKMKGWW